jgi:hypothetical protein
MILIFTTFARYHTYLSLKKCGRQENNVQIILIELKITKITGCLTQNEGRIPKIWKHKREDILEKRRKHM